MDGESGITEFSSEFPMTVRRHFRIPVVVVADKQDGRSLRKLVPLARAWKPLALDCVSVAAGNDGRGDVLLQLPDAAMEQAAELAVAAAGVAGDEADGLRTAQFIAVVVDQAHQRDRVSEIEVGDDGGPIHRVLRQLSSGQPHRLYGPVPLHLRCRPRLSGGRGALADGPHINQVSQTGPAHH